MTSVKSCRPQLWLTNRKPNLSWLNMTYSLNLLGDQLILFTACASLHSDPIPTCTIDTSERWKCYSMKRCRNDGNCLLYASTLWFQQLWIKVYLHVYSRINPTEMEDIKDWGSWFLVDIQTTMDNLQHCVRGAYEGAPFSVRLDRPIDHKRFR